MDPGFAAVALLSLALGIGANTALFQLLDAVRLRSVPVEDPKSLALVDLADSTGQRGSRTSPYPALTNPLWERFRDHQDAFAGVLAWANNDFDLGPNGEGRARGLFVSGDFFRVLGVRPVLGRTFTASEDRRGCGLPGVVVSHAFWQRELGGDKGVVGRTLTLGHQPVEILGVTSAGFTGLEAGRSFDVAVPICAQAALWSEGHWLDEGTVWWLTVLGRLAPGTTMEGANARLRALSPGIFESTLPANYPAANVKDYRAFRLAAGPAATGVSWLRGQYVDPLVLLLGTSGIVLLITCFNLANLMLARAAARTQEVAVRLALGASRGRVGRERMAEATILAAAGGGLGVLLSGSLSQFLVTLLATEGNSPFLDLEPNRAILAFAFGLSTLTCLLFGLVPALRATRLAPGSALKTAGRAVTASRDALALRRALVVSQVAFSLVLLVGALLFSRTLANVLSVDAGFKPSGVLVANLDLSRAAVPAAREALRGEVIDRIRAVGGVTSAAEVGIVPFTGSMSNRVWTQGAEANHGLESKFSQIGPGYLQTMSMNLLRGRDFDSRDSARSPNVAIVNQTLARQLGFGDQAVGRRFHREATPSKPEQSFEIVGLVADSKYGSLREAFAPIAFLPTSQSQPPDFYVQLVLRSAAPLSDLTPRVRSAVVLANPAIGVDFRSFETIVREGLLRERLMATLSGFFGVLATLIAALGLYGVMAYSVARRTHEIGIRMALGANRTEVVGLVLREAMALLAAGLTLGTGLALAAGRTAESMLYGLRAHDSATIALAVTLLAAVTGAAAYLPSRRAATLDPMTALREE
jgi:predicted permease